MKKEHLSDMIARRLTTEFRGLYSHVARATGLPFSSVSRMARKESSPSLDTAEVMIDFLAAYDASWNGRKPSAGTPDAFLKLCVSARTVAAQKTAPIGCKRKK